MKKRLLMPLIVAGMMVASVVMLDACKKSDDANKIDMETITMVETPVYRAESDPGIRCPYCHVYVLENDTTHWHTFGTRPDAIGQFPVDYCNTAYNLDNEAACKYSGYYYNIPTSSHYHDDAWAPRYHAHRVCCTNDLPGHWEGHNGQHNEWHVGGGTSWPDPAPVPEGLHP